MRLINIKKKALTLGVSALAMVPIANYFLLYYKNLKMSIF